MTRVWRPFMAALAAVALAFLPVLSNEYFVFLAGLAAIYALAGLGLTVITGWGGQLSLAHAGFMGAGAYLSAILIGQGAPWILALGSAVVICACLGLIVGLPAVRLRGLYLAVATLAFGELVVHALIEFRGVTGGVAGLAVRPIRIGSATSGLNLYYLTVVITASVFAALVWLEGTAFGRKLKSVRDVQIATGALGISATRTKLTGFALSAAIAGLAGTLYAQLVGFVTPRTFSVGLMVQLLVIVFVGGLKWPVGSIAGAVLLVALRQILQDTGPLQTVLFGGLLMLTIGVLPDGLVSIWHRLQTRLQGANTFQHAGTALPIPKQPPAGPTTVDHPRTSRTRRTRPDGDRAALAVQDITVAFGGNVALKRVSLVFRSGFQGLVGPNGAGKTTLFNVVTGYVQPSSGSVSLDGENITGWSPRRVAHAGVARTFQTPKLVGELSVLDNALLAAESHPESTPAGARRQARELLEEFGLSEIAATPASQLPLALMKIVELVRALASAPRLLLLDEPVAGLTAPEIDALVTPLIAHATASGCAVVIVEHDLELIRRICDETFVLNFGECLAQGDPTTVFQRPDVLSAYLGGGLASVDA